MVPRRQSRGCRRPADLRRPRHRRELRACLDRHVPVRRQPARAGRRAVRRATGELDLHGRQGSPVQGSLMPIDDPTEVQAQYAQEDNLRARQALWQGATGTDPKEVLWRTIEEWQPKRLLEVGGGQGELAERIGSELGAGGVFLALSPRGGELGRGRGGGGGGGGPGAAPRGGGTQGSSRPGTALSTGSPGGESSPPPGTSPVRGP